MDQKSFWLMSNSLISSEDIRTLALLYQPLIGSDGFGTYLLMFNLINQNNLQTDVYPIQYLLDLLHLNKDLFTANIHKLEAIGLLTTFLKDDIYLYRLNMPLKPRQFFLDGILGSYLKSEIGTENFNRLFSYFSVPEASKKGYKNVTKSFDDIYKIKKLDLLKSEKFIFGRKNGGGIIIRDAFDFESLFEQLPPRLKKRSIYTKKVVSQIASVMYVYNFTSAEMIEILTNAYDNSSNKIFIEKIAVLANHYFTKTYGDNLVTIEKRPEEDLEIDLSTIRPQDIITVFGQKMTDQSYALDTIRQFIERNAVDIGLINGIILVALKYHDQLPSLAYLEKVLADWLARGITTASDAMLILKQAEKRPKKTYRKRRKPGIEGEEPEWLDEIIESFWKDEAK